MLDRHINKIIDKPLKAMAVEIARLDISANQITVMAMIMGVVAFIQTIYGNYLFSLFFILLNRLFDGLDGKVAQISSPSDSGGFLDIVFDFIFYSAIPLGFGISTPDYSLAASVLIFSFVTTGTTFLAFSVMAEKNQLHSIDYPNKSIYYLGGIVEGSETIFLFILICIFPTWFNFLAYIFATLCLFTAIFRMIFGYKTLKKVEKRRKIIKNGYR